MKIANICYFRYFFSFIISFMIINLCGCIDDESSKQNIELNLSQSVTIDSVELTFLRGYWKSDYFYVEFNAKNVGNIQQSVKIENITYETENGFLYEGRFLAGGRLFEAFNIEPGRNSTLDFFTPSVDKDFLPVSKVYMDINGAGVTLSLL